MKPSNEQILRAALQEILDSHKSANRMRIDLFKIARAALAATAPESVPDPVRYAKELATAIWQRHYATEAPQWKVLPDMYGALSQIDNMITGLTRKPESATRIVQDHVVRICPDRDIECGDFSQNWCATCPKSAPADEPTEAYWAITSTGQRCAFGVKSWATGWAGKGGRVETIPLTQLALVEPSPSDDDPVVLWARIHRLEADAKGPDGFATWKDAAIAERLRRTHPAPSQSADQFQARPICDDKSSETRMDTGFQAGRNNLIAHVGPSQSADQVRDAALVEVALLAEQWGNARVDDGGGNALRNFACHVMKIRNSKTAPAATESAEQRAESIRQERIGEAVAYWKCTWPWQLDNVMFHNGARIVKAEFEARAILATSSAAKGE